MRKRLGILLVAAVIVLAIVTVTILRRPADPIYQGKRLSAWLGMYDLSRGRGPSSENDQAMDAIRHIGTNARPVLLDRLNYEPPISRYPVCHRLPNWFLTSGPVWSMLANPKAAIRAETAAAAFGVLGAAATPAIPELMRRANVIQPSARRDNALLALTRALAHFEHPPAPLLAAVTSMPDYRAHILLGLCLGQLGNNARPFVPLLVENLHHTNAAIATINAMLLGNLRLEPAMVVPALAKCLQHPNADLRRQAAMSLTRFGEAASAALPALTNVLSDPDRRMRTSASIAIQTISYGVRTVAPAQ